MENFHQPDQHPRDLDGYKHTFFYASNNDAIYYLYLGHCSTRNKLQLKCPLNSQEVVVGYWTKHTHIK